MSNMAHSVRLNTGGDVHSPAHGDAAARKASSSGRMVCACSFVLSGGGLCIAQYAHALRTYSGPFICSTMWQVSWCQHTEVCEVTMFLEKGHMELCHSISNISRLMSWCPVPTRVRRVSTSSTRRSSAVLDSLADRAASVLRCCSSWSSSRSRECTMGSSF